MSIPLPIYIDGRAGSSQINPLAAGTTTLDVASPIGTPRFSAPFQGDSTVYKIEQDYEQFTINYAALALNTAHPDYASYYLTGESALADQGGGLCRWTRTYCAIPNTRNDYTSIAYSFIGYYGKVANLASFGGNFPIIGRPRQTKTVTCRVQNDYFFCAIGQTYTTPAAVPVILATKYYIPQGTLVLPGTFVYTYPPGTTADMANGSDTDFLWDPASWGGYIPTAPSRATYQGWVNAGTEVVAEASQLSRWAGNIYQRQTKYVVAL